MSANNKHGFFDVLVRCGRFCGRGRARSQP